MSEIYPLLYSMVEIGLAQVVGNSIVLLVILRTTRMRTRTNFFLANLAVADLSVGVFCVLPTLSRFISQTWKLGRVMCKVYYYVNQMSYTTSIILLTVISIERYIAILYPLKAQQWITISRLKLCLAAIWVVAAGYNIPILVIFDAQMFAPTMSTVTYCFPSSPAIMYSLHIADLIVFYVIPLLLMSFMYSRISVVLWTSGSKLRLDDAATESGNNSSNRAHSRSGFPMQQTTKPPRHDKVPGKGNKKGMRQSPSVVTTESHVYFHSEEDLRMESTIAEDLNSQIAESGFNRDACETDQMQKQLKALSTQAPKTVIKPTLYQRLKNAMLCRKPPPTISIATPDDDESSSQEWNRNESIAKTSSVDTARRNTLRARKKVIRLLLSVVISFSLCVLPYHVNEILVSHGIVFSQFYPPLSFLILYLNSGLNPILYALLSENFRRSLRETLTCRRCV